MSSPPIANGVVEVEWGRITAVHDRIVPHAVDLGNVALLPGLVNTHTHLEFSDLSSPVVPPQPFTEWIKSLVAVRRASPATREVLQQGLAECHAHGTALVGEIATQDWPPEAYQHAGIRKVVFRELIGMLPERAAAQLEIARHWLEGPDGPFEPITNYELRITNDAESTLIRGLSPHAPYTVHPDLYRDLVKLAAEKRAPVAIHLAETEAELEFLRCGTGEFVALLERFNAWDPHAIPRGTRPLDYLLPLAAVPNGLVIHGNYLAPPEIDWLARHPHVSVVYCPQTHAFFKHPPHPWLELLDRGINVALGTDGRGSNPDLSLWREMQFLARRFPQVDPAELLALGTLAGAKALGRDSDLGSLEPGKRADLAVVRLQPNSPSNPHLALFSTLDATNLSNIQEWHTWKS